jgi:hypothetical protein
MTAGKPHDPHFAERVAASFQRQTVMTTLGAQLRQVTPGAVRLPYPIVRTYASNTAFSTRVC